jgi:hypothetical protein
MMDARVAGDEVIACFSCGRGMTYCGPRADGSSGRFCTDRCRDYWQPAWNLRQLGSCGSPRTGGLGCLRRD